MKDKTEGKRALARGGMSRRAFLAGSLAAGAATARALAGCAPSADGSSSPVAQGEEPKWDKEVDIVVAGSGMSSFAALKAHMDGDSVVVLEKRPFLGGTAAISGGAVRVPMNTLQDDSYGPDDRDEAISYVKRIAEGAADDELIESFVDGSQAFFEWTNDELGCPCFAHADGAPVWDLYMPLEGSKMGRTLKIDRNLWRKGAEYGAQIDGEALFNWLLERAEQEDLDMMTSTEAARLITNSDGVVTGVEASQNGKAYYAKARKGVLLSTGGFDRDADMRKAHLRMELCSTAAVEANRGDAIKMALDLGADLAQMQSVWGCAAWCPIDATTADSDELQSDWHRFDIQCERTNPHSLIVNQYGVRFVNESANYHTFNRGFEMWDAGADHMGRSAGYLIVDGTFLQNYALPLGGGVPGNIPEYAVQADSLEELAEKAGIDYANLAWQVEQFNSFCETGRDPQFHRGENEWDLLKNSKAAEIENLPQPLPRQGRDPAFRGHEGSARCPGHQGRPAHERKLPGAHARRRAHPAPLRERRRRQHPARRGLSGRRRMPWQPCRHGVRGHGGPAVRRACRVGPR